MQKIIREKENKKRCMLEIGTGIYLKQTNKK